MAVIIDTLNQVGMHGLAGISRGFTSLAARLVAALDGAGDHRVRRVS